MTSGACTIIVVAAGSGTRFVVDGEASAADRWERTVIPMPARPHKLAQPIGDTSVLEATLEHAVASRLHVVVVTTAAFVDVATRTVAARDVVVVPEAGAGDGFGDGTGMGHSIAAGVRASPSSSAWLVLPGDMPLVRPSSILAVARAIEHHHPVAYAQYLGRRGHPVGFAAELFSELIVLSGDEGARRLVARYPAFAVDVDDPGVLVDIDTEADLASARRTFVAGESSGVAG